MKRKYWLITVVALWVAAAVDAVAIAVAMLRHRDFDWPSFVGLGIILVAALLITVAWGSSKDAKTDQAPP
jgi:protein-S-isoprenylcysteine O-methyltransferase Ste14